MHRKHPLAWASEATDYATTHCRRCEAGWTRTGRDTAGVVVCLLDREPVLPNMTYCDRFTPREDLEQPNPMPERSTG